jgi:outer membrane beta-barrel protein
LSAGQNVAAQAASTDHEMYLHTGFYAADRFQNSLNIGIAYDFHFASRFSMGASFGFARAGQEYIQKVLSAAPEQGSSAVIYYNGRITHSVPFGKIVPYSIIALGVTRQHSESNLTFSLGLGTKFPIGRTTYIRYEINDHIFSSGKDNTAWTNNNLEISIGVSFFLQ